MKLKQVFTFRDEKNIDLYLSDLEKYKLLSPEEEIELFKKIEKGDEKAKEKIILSNLRFVVSVAKQFQGQGLSLSDLINEGNLGLIKAVEKFDYTKGFKFITYAVWWIKQHIMLAISNYSRTIRLPVNRLNEIFKINKIKEEILQHTEDDQEVFLNEALVFEKAKETGITEENFIQATYLKKFQKSLDEPVGEEKNSTLKEFIPDNSFNIEGRLDHEALKLDLKKFLNNLSEKEKTVLTLYYGLDGKAPLTLEKISEQFELTRERVRQIKMSALRKLKHSDNIQQLREYL